MKKRILKLELLTYFHLVFFYHNACLSLLFVWRDCQQNLLVLVVLKSLIIKDRLLIIQNWHLSKMNLVPKLVYGWIPTDKKLSYLALLIHFIPVFPYESLLVLFRVMNCLYLSLVKNIVKLKVDNWQSLFWLRIQIEEQKMAIMKVLF